MDSAHRDQPEEVLAASDRVSALSVSEVMNPSVITISEEAALAEALGLLRHHRISSLVVADHAGQMVGVISQTDLLGAWEGGAEAAAVLQRPVSQYMTRDVISCAPHQSLDYAMRLLNQHRIHRLVIVAPQSGRYFVSDRLMPVGILSQTDIVRALVGQPADNAVATPASAESEASGERQTAGISSEAGERESGTEPAP